MKELFQKILNYDRTSPLYIRFKTVILWVCGIILLLAFFFGYTANTNIDDIEILNSKQKESKKKFMEEYLLKCFRIFCYL